MGRLTAALVLAASLALAAAQPTGVLKVTVTVTARDGSAHPVPRHPLLISDNPVTAAPQRFVTRSDGTVEIHLRPGNYTVESEDAFVFEGKAYQWTRPVSVAPTGETAVALTTDDAMIEAARPGAASEPAAAEAPAHGDLPMSVVTMWTPRAIGHAFLFDARGLLATNQRLVGNAASVEIQVTPEKKVAGRVLASDPQKNVAILWIDPKAASPARPLPIAFAQGDKAAVSEHDTVYSVEAESDGGKTVVSGRVDRVTAHTIATDVPLNRTSDGVPIVNADGAVVAIATASDEATVVNELSPRAVRIDDLRAAIAEAEKKMAGAAPPSAAPLPVDPVRPFPKDALQSALKGRGGSPSAYLVAAADFDVVLITPPVLYASLHKGDREQFDYGGRNPAEMQPALRALEDFGTWNEYVADAPPVVMIRVTPKFGESFWTTVARGAAQTQGVAIPAIKRPKAAFGSLRLACGDREVVPIHPLRIGHRVDDGSTLDEGFYVFDASTFDPQCGAMKITLFSDKPGDKGDVRTVDARIVQQVWDDFAAYRAASSSSRTSTSPAPTVSR